ncbi:MAG: hypothetical protein M1816_006548 [Peltula sp. TS41687]|nr:MAG: hypothetical protein M1816_006548 [Peltula sp. TS41687]
MCIGRQEIYTACGCRGSFVTYGPEGQECASLTSCPGRTEWGIVYKSGSLCPRCHRIKNPPNWAVCYPSNFVPHDTPRPHEFHSFQELDEHYRWMIYWRRSAVNTASDKLLEARQTEKWRRELEAASAELAAAEQAFEMEAALFRMEELKLEK